MVLQSRGFLEVDRVKQRIVGVVAAARSTRWEKQERERYNSETAGRVLRESWARSRKSTWNKLGHVLLIYVATTKCSYGDRGQVQKVVVTTLVLRSALLLRTATLASRSGLVGVARIVVGLCLCVQYYSSERDTLDYICSCATRACAFCPL